MTSIPVIVMGDHSGRYIQYIESTRGNVSVVRHVHELTEVLGIAHTGIARAVLLVSDFEDLTQSLVAQMQEAQLGVVLINDPGTTQPVSNVVVVSSLAEPQEVLEALERSIELPHGENSAPTSTEEAGTSKKPSDTSTSPFSTPPATSSFVEEGKIIAVWGPAGSPGRSTVASNLAAIFTQTQEKVCLIDADTYAPSISAQLGLLDDYSTLSQLCHLAERGQLDESKLLEVINTVKVMGKELDLATGITRADRWPEIRSVALEIVLNVARTIYDVVIVDCGFSLEADEEISFDGIAPRRNGATLAALEAADKIVVLGNADVVGTPRLIHAVNDLTSSPVIEIDKSRVHVWFNKVRSSAVGKSPTEHLVQSWQRFGPEVSLEGFLPFCPDDIDKAWLSGQTLIECASKAPITDELRAMSTKLLSEEKAVNELTGEQEVAVQRREHESLNSTKRTTSRFGSWRRRKDAS